MYQKLSYKITDSLIEKNIVAEEDKIVYRYSIEVFLSDIFYLLIAFFTALITQSLAASIAFFIGFLSLRKFSGGYHAKTYLRCHFLFWTNQILMIILYHFLLPEYSKILSFVFIAFSITSVLVFAPVANGNKPLSKEEKSKYTWMSRMVIILDAIIVTALSFTDINFEYVCMYTFGAFSVSVSLIAEKIKYMKRSR